MRNSILKAVMALALLTVTGGAYAGPGKDHGDDDDDRRPPTPVKVPEIPASGFAAGLVVVLGGVAVVMGRRRRRSE
jgi:hypothetical protein